MMRRISPFWVLLLAAGCANAGIGDWLNPFSVFGGKKHGSASAPSGASHSPKSSGHRGSRQLHPSHGGGYHHPSTSHSHYSPGHANAPPAPLLGSLPGSLDDGFKPSFPPGFANPPSYSPNLNPFATLAGHGSEAIAKGPFLPSQLTTYHIPKVDPGHASAPLTKPVPLPSNIGNSNYGGRYFGFGGGRGRRHRGGVPPHAAVSSGSINGDGTGPINPDGSPVSYDQFPGLASEIEPHNQPEYEETPTTPPQAAPQRGARGPRGPFSFLSRGRHRQGGPSHHHHHGGSGNQFGRRPQHSGPPGGPPGGSQGPQGPDGPSFIDGSGPESQNPFGGDGPSFGNEGPQQNPFGNDGLQQNHFGHHEQTQNLFGNNGPLSGGPGPLNGGSPLAGPSIGGGNQPGGQDVFFATSPGSNSPFAQGPPEQGSEGPSPFGNPESNSQFSQGGPSPRPGGLFGRGQSSAPQGPPRGLGGPGGPNGPQAFFGANGNDYPEQFGGGNRGPRQPSPQSSIDYRPQPNGPPDAPNNGEGQSPGFFGALHDSERNPQLSNFFGNNNGPQAGPGGQDGPNNGGPSPFGSTSGNPYGNAIQAQGEGGPGFGNNPNHHSNAPGGPRKPPMRSFFRNPLAGIFQGSSSNLPSHNNNNQGPLAMSASGAKPAISLPMAKVGRVLRPFLKKPGSILPLSSPRDPNYRPMSLGASNLSPISAPFEPDTAASGGYGGGYGNVGLTNNGDRILYHVGNHKGPHSYQFGYDTGKGHNRIFRFEEKDGHGFVKGKYGFYDKSGKLNIINYMAHPKHGYHAERGHSHGHY